jgi:hypothetical protein
MKRLISDACRGVFAIALAIAVTVCSPSGAAAQEYPDFYGTVVAADRSLGFVVILVDQGEEVLVHVQYLGEAPWNEGVFQLDKVVILRTQRIGPDYMAISWEEARNGRERFSG